MCEIEGAQSTVRLGDGLEQRLAAGVLERVIPEIERTESIVDAQRLSDGNGTSVADGARWPRV